MTHRTRGSRDRPYNQYGWRFFSSNLLTPMPASWQPNQRWYVEHCAQPRARWVASLVGVVDSRGGGRAQHQQLRGVSLSAGVCIRAKAISVATGLPSLWQRHVLPCAENALYCRATASTPASYTLSLSLPPASSSPLPSSSPAPASPPPPPPASHAPAQVGAAARG